MSALGKTCDPTASRGAEERQRLAAQRRCAARSRGAHGRVEGGGGPRRRRWQRVAGAVAPLARGSSGFGIEREREILWL